MEDDWIIDDFEQLQKELRNAEKQGGQDNGMQSSTEQLGRNG